MNAPMRDLSGARYSSVQSSAAHVKKAPIREVGRRIYQGGYPA